MPKNESFNAAVEKYPPSHYTNSSLFLKDIFSFLKENLKKYSFTEFAKDLGFSPSNVVYLYVQGNRPLTVKAAATIANSLNLSSFEAKYFNTLIQYENCKNPVKRELMLQNLISIKHSTKISHLNKIQLRFFDEWYHPIIREMITLPNFNSDPHWIAAQIIPNIRPKQAAESLKILQELNLVKFNETENKYCVTENSISTGDEIASLSIVRYFQHMIDLGKESITAIDESERDVSAIVVSLDRPTFESVKKEVQLFRRRILQMCESVQNPEFITQLNMQFFPVSVKGKKKNEEK